MINSHLAQGERNLEIKPATHHAFGHGGLPAEADISVDVVVTRPEFEDRHRGKFHDFRRFQTSSEDRWHPVPFYTKFRVGHYQQVLPPLDANAGTTGPRLTAALSPTIVVGTTVVIEFSI